MGTLAKVALLPYIVVLIPIATAWVCGRQAPPELSSTILNAVSGLLTMALMMVIVRQRRRLEALSVLDTLTGVFNSGHLRAELDRHLRLAHEGGLPLAAIFLDVDDLKAINDRYGHMAGNAALRQLGRRLIAATRGRDDLCFRFGGDEFMVLCPRTDLEAARDLARRLRAPPAGLRTFAGRRPTLSIGVVQLRERESAGEFLRRADRAMYSAKLAGKGGVLQEAA